MIPPKRQHQPPLLSLFIHLPTNLPRHSRHRTRVLHPAMRRVLRGDQTRIAVHRGVAVQGIPEVVAQLGEQAGVDERGGRGVDAGLALPA